MSEPLHGEPELCREYNNDDGPLLECDLPKGHEGDHHAHVSWPSPAPWHHSEPTAMSEATYRIWAKTLERMLAPMTWDQLRDAATESHE